MPLQRVMAATHSVSAVLIHRIHGAPRTVALTTSHAGAVRAGWCVISTKRSITIWLAVLILPSLPAAITRPAHGDHAQAVNGEFARQNQHDDPARQRPALDEHHHGGEVEQLVRDGVDELAEIGNQVAGAGDMAVKIIRQGSDGEHGSGEQIANEGLREHQRHHHRNQRDAQERQFVGQVHAITPVRS